MVESIPPGPGPVLATFLDPNGLNQWNADAAAKIYRTLKPGEMRLLRLHHGTGRLRCSLLITSDDPPPEYEALSYVWGSHTDLKRIYLNDRRYFATSNLFDALQRLRSRDKDRILWIDALVINQSDLNERTTEVTKMSAIFSRAVRTLVWLGGGNNKIEKDMRALGYLNVETANLNPGPGGIGVPIHHAVRNIESVAYWNRAWVVQELMYSSEDAVLLLYGSSSLLWGHFVKIVDKGILNIDLSLSDVKFGHTKLAIRPGFGRRKWYMRLPNWIKNYCGGRECTESRDRVFAYHGCFPPEVRNRVTIDYKMSLEEIAMNVTIAWTESERDLDFLSQIGCRENWVSTQCIPSWIPNYFGTRTTANRLIVESPDESAGQAISSPHFRFMHNSSILEVKGTRIGDIDAVGKPSTKTKISQVEGLSTFLLDQVWGSEGSIEKLGPKLKALVLTYFTREDLQCKFADDHRVAEKVSVSYDSFENDNELDKVERLVHFAHFVLNRKIISFRFVPTDIFHSVQKESVSIPFGFGTSELKVGDQVYLILGCSVPLILRKVGEQYMVVGNTSVFGLSSGHDLENKLRENSSEAVNILELC
jgi:hypothetical protein